MIVISINTDLESAPHLHFSSNAVSFVYTLKIVLLVPQLLCYLIFSFKQSLVSDLEKKLSENSKTLHPLVFHWPHPYLPPENCCK